MNTKIVINKNNEIPKRHDATGVTPLVRPPTARLLGAPVIVSELNFDITIVNCFLHLRVRDKSRTHWQDHTLPKILTIETKSDILICQVSYNYHTQHIWNVEVAFLFSKLMRERKCCWFIIILPDLISCQSFSWKKIIEGLEYREEGSLGMRSLYQEAEGPLFL